MKLTLRNWKTFAGPMMLFLAVGGASSTIILGVLGLTMYLIGQDIWPTLSAVVISSLITSASWFLAWLTAMSDD